MCSLCVTSLNHSPSPTYNSLAATQNALSNCFLNCARSVNVSFRLTERVIIHWCVQVQTIQKVLPSYKHHSCNNEAK